MLVRSVKPTLFLTSKLRLYVRTLLLLVMRHGGIIVDPFSGKNIATFCRMVYYEWKYWIVILKIHLIILQRYNIEHEIFATEDAQTYNEE